MGAVQARVLTRPVLQAAADAVQQHLRACWVAFDTDAGASTVDRDEFGGTHRAATSNGVAVEFTMDSVISAPDRRLGRCATLRGRARTSCARPTGHLSPGAGAGALPGRDIQIPSREEAACRTVPCSLTGVAAVHHRPQRHDHRCVCTRSDGKPAVVKRRR
jgi:hypothetical protein